MSTMSLMKALLVFCLVTVATAQKLRASCGPSVFTLQQATFDFPAGSDYYDNNMRCTWTIDTPGPIRITLSNMDIEHHSSCDWDALKVYNEGLFGTYCGQTSRSFLVFSDNVRITFTSDGTEVGRGFTLSYEGAYEVAVYTGECGVPNIPPTNIQGRIVGGVEATPHSWPWQVDVKVFNLYHLCGASILNNRWIISAAHCFVEIAADDFSLVVGSHYQDVVEIHEESHNIENVIVHENYNSASVNNDIALIRVSEDIEFNDHVRPICLPDAGIEWPPGGNCYTTGWGATEGTGDSNNLNQVNVPIIDRDTCNQAHWYGGAVSQTMVCAGYEQGGKDSCQGDSGGPLVCEDNEGGWVLVGLTSWGYGCADSYNPGVYTNVAHLREWIDSTIY